MTQGTERSLLNGNLSWQILKLTDSVKKTLLAIYTYLSSGEVCRWDQRFPVEIIRLGRYENQIHTFWIVWKERIDSRYIHFLKSNSLAFPHQVIPP
jgi:hypothetical protein